MKGSNDARSSKSLILNPKYIKRCQNRQVLKLFARSAETLMLSRNCCTMNINAETYEGDGG